MPLVGIGAMTVFGRALRIVIDEEEGRGVAL